MGSVLEKVKGSVGGDVVTIFGSTGTGKTKLSVQLAQAISQAADNDRFGEYKAAEVVSCDSMQIYRGLDIITNKATEEEMAGVPHHLMGFLSPGLEYDVTQFVADTNDIAMRLRSNRALPIVCGGTTYYLQHLLFPGRLITTHAKLASPSMSMAEDDALLDSLTSEERELWSKVGSKSVTKQSLASEAASDTQLAMQLWTLLQKVDPDMAARWHWKDARKTANSLRVFRETGQRQSEWIKQQDLASVEQTAETLGTDGEQKVAGYRKLLFWVWCEPEVLKARLDDRVDEMVERGLVDEVREMQDIAKKILYDVAGTDSTAYQNGIFQTIGYKHFDEYLRRLAELKTKKLSRQGHDNDALHTAVTNTKTGTRQYAKSQLKWITNKLMPEVRRVQMACAHANDVQVYLLDTTDPSAWDEKVAKPAIEIVSKFLRREALPDPCSISNPSAAHAYLLRQRSPNQALERSASISEGALDSAIKAEGMRTIQANALYKCHVCTLDEKAPFFVRVVDRAVHEKGRVHRNSINKQLTPSEKDARIAKQIREGLQKKAAREKARAEMEALKNSSIAEKT